ncbi:hypothetical protein IKF33_01210 [Candidatus Saccharibacteria bacterium]|nr:hypothetical protein [Candidatus Saccharibacteria bacterium]
MLTTAMFKWWYTVGWKTFFDSFLERLGAVADQFSIGTLLATLFYPFRQIDSGHLVNASINERFQAFIARTISRFIGAAVRLVVAGAGILTLALTVIIGFIANIIWPLIPLAPIVCVVLAIMQVVF